MNKKGDANIVGMILGILTVGLFLTVITLSITDFGTNYDITGYDNETFANMTQESTSLQNTLEEQSDTINDIVVEANLFDYFAGIFNTIIAPFKFIYQSYKIVIGMTSQAVSTFNIYPIFASYLGSVVIALVVIGIVAIGIYMNRRK